MVEKNSGVPSTVVVPVQQPEKGEIVPDVEVAPQVKRSRKAKSKQDPDADPVPNQDPVNADKPAPSTADVAVADDPLVTAETRDPVAPSAEEPVAIPDQKRRPKRPRAPPAIEHKRVVHYYRESRPNKRHGRSGDDENRHNGGSSRGRHTRDEKKTGRDERRSDGDDDDDDDELLSDSDWNVDSDSDSDPSDNESKSDDGFDADARVPGSNKQSGKKHESEKGARRDDDGRYAPVRTVIQYKIV